MQDTLGGGDSSAEKQSVYSTAPADWASNILHLHLKKRHTSLINDIYLFKKKNLFFKRIIYSIFLL